MRKFLLLIPVAIAAAAGTFWVSATNTALPPQHARLDEKLPEGSQALFSVAERSLRSVVRHGEDESISALGTSLDAISSELTKRRQQGFSVDKIEHLLAQYRQDSTVLTQNFSPKLREIRLYDAFEQENEPKFLTAIEQIGLYELRTAYADLGKMRTEYLKKPSAESRNGYEAQYGKVKTIITELYLDSVIETPLFAYLENHKHYFETIAASYEKIGLERVLRLRENGYAIKTELQLLPIL